MDLVVAGESDVQSAVEDSIRRYLADEALKKGYVSYAKVGSAILDVVGVEDYIPVSDGAVPVLGTVSIT